MNKILTNPIVLYSNDLNDVSFAELTKTENKLFRAIITRVANQGCNQIELTYEELKEMIKAKKNFTTLEMTQNIDSLYDKLDTFFTYKSISKDHIIDKVHFFTSYRIDPNKQTAKIAVNSDFTPFFNNLKNNFTYYELSEFVRLKNKYAISLYPLLMQYQNTGVYIIGFEKFCNLLGLTVGALKNLDSRVLVPAVEEINRIIPNFNLRYEKELGYHMSVKNIKFTFKKRRRNKTLVTEDSVSVASENTHDENSNISFVKAITNINVDILNSHEKKLINKWFSRYGFNADEIKTMITTAKNIAERNQEQGTGKTDLVNISYIDGILKSWSSRGIRSIQDLPLQDMDSVPRDCCGMTMFLFDDFDATKIPIFEP